MEELDYNKPICATSAEENVTYILLPRIQGSCYSVTGYDWFNIESGEWNSCVCWKTKEDAIRRYEDMCYNVRNCKIKVEVL